MDEFSWWLWRLLWEKNLVFISRVNSIPRAQSRLTCKRLREKPKKLWPLPRHKPV
jgi:hypothetical protein